MKTASSNKKIRELISLVRDGKLIPRPEFQRRLVWTNKDKSHFLDSILRGYPFPEIYLADGEVDLDTGDGTQLLVDGLQRVSTIVQYFEADSDLRLMSVPPYKSLLEEEKQRFLQYDVSVRDLGQVNRTEIIEVFQRINATKYALKDIEINNAVYNGALRQFADDLASEPFFYDHKVFNATDYKRMGDLRFSLLVIITVLGGYFNRDDAFEEYLERYNEEFDAADDVRTIIAQALDFIDECGFTNSSRAWRKADLFTLIIEVALALINSNIKLSPTDVVNRVQKFYDSISNDLSDGSISGIYYKAALQASNDRLNRMRRGEIISGTIVGRSEGDIMEGLRVNGLI